MNINFNLLPKKAKRKLEEIKKILSNADDKLYCVVQVDYNSGMIRFESMQHDSLFINLYTTTFTITVEHRAPGERNKQSHWGGLYYKKVNKIFNKPKNYLN